MSKRWKLDLLDVSSSHEFTYPIETAGHITNTATISFSRHSHGSNGWKAPWKCWMYKANGTVSQPARNAAKSASSSSAKMLSNDCTLDTCSKENLARVLDQNLVLVWWDEMTKNCGWCAVGNRPHSILCTELPRVPRKIAFHDWGAESQANQNAYLILVQHTPTVCWRRGTSSWAGETDEHNSTQPDNYHKLEAEYDERRVI